MLRPNRPPQRSHCDRNPCRDDQRRPCEMTIRRARCRELKRDCRFRAGRMVRGIQFGRRNRSRRGRQFRGQRGALRPRSFNSIAEAPRQPQCGKPPRRFEDGIKSGECNVEFPAIPGRHCILLDQAWRLPPQPPQFPALISNPPAVKLRPSRRRYAKGPHPQRVQGSDSSASDERATAPCNGCSMQWWWALQDSNLRLPPCEDGTLPLS